MEIINETFANIEFLKPQTYENLTVIGIKTDNTNNKDILSLQKALELDLVQINEVSQEGSVNNLKVENESNIPLIILDGEELLGAKQNRILNTTVIIPPKTELTVPVSCTEQGRWRYNSKKFEKSENIASGRLRLRKNKSVYNSLKQRNTFESNQREVWNEVHALGALFGSSSQTEALSDTYQYMKQDTDEYLKNIQYNKGQTGSIIFLNGKLINLEMVYNTDIYKNCHEKIIKSNVLDSLTLKEENQKEDIGLIRDADDFLQLISNDTFEKFTPVGIGEDYRINSDNILGSMLSYEDKIAHALFFNKNQDLICENIS